MHNYTRHKNLQKILIASAVLLPSLAFSADDSACTACNRGYVYVSDKSNVSSSQAPIVAQDAPQAAPVQVSAPVMAVPKKAKVATPKTRAYIPESKARLLTQLQQEARVYRAQGFKSQESGDLETAEKFYSKAIELDRLYAIPHNDLGIIYESRGDVDRAEKEYRQAIAIDSEFLSAYTNLAILYEGKRDLVKALECWTKRADLGDPSDPWTTNAQQRVQDIKVVLSSDPQRDAQQDQVVGLLGDVSIEKSAYKKDNKQLAKGTLIKSKLAYKKGDEVTAFKLAVDALQLDPANREAQELVQKLERRLLSK